MQITVLGLPGHSFPWDLETSEQYPEQSSSPKNRRVDRLPVTTEQAVTRPNERQTGSLGSPFLDGRESEGR